jgi:lipid II:glycine glycyltransferase (peptidoglycan interpeptide bridge formation enzyme)/ubiquinone/menaquinone biosynthesis C-methylase UbiE
VFLAKYKDEYIAGRLALNIGNKIWDQYAGTNRKHTELKANHLLVWEMVKWGKTKECVSLDFRGAGAWNDPKHPDRGIYDFKSKFGPQLCEIIGEYFIVYKEGLFSFYISLGQFAKDLVKRVSKLKGIFSSVPYADKMSKMTFDKFGEKEELEEYTKRTMEFGQGYEDKFLMQYLKAPADILVQGCGAGREAVHLAKKGFSVTATDFQPKMVELAKENSLKLGLKIDFKTMNACNLEYPVNKFDAVIMFGPMISLIPGRANRIKALAEAKKVLKDGGKLLISFPSKYYNYKYSMYFFVMDNFRKLLNLFSIKTMEPGDRLAKRVSGNVVSKGKSFLHMYSIKEIKEDLASSGLEFIEARSRNEIENDLKDPSITEKDYFVYISAVKNNNKVQNQNSTQTRYLLPIDESKKGLFNNFVAGSKYGHIFQSYEWGEVKRGDGWIPHRYILEDNGVIKASILLLERKLLSYSILYAPRGPIVDYSDSETFSFLITELKKLPIFKKAIFLQIDPYRVHRDNKIHNLLSDNGFILKKCGFFYIEQPKYVFILDITQSLEDIYNNFSPSTKRNIKIAEKNNITVEIRDDIEAMDDFYRILRSASSRKHFLVRPSSYHKRIFNFIIKNGFGKVFLMKYKGETIAARMALNFGNRSWGLYAASSRKYSKLQVSYLMMWETIKWAKSKGCISLDLRGAGAWDIPNHPNRGIYEFKVKFGPELCEMIGEYFMVFNKELFSLYVFLGDSLSKLLKLPGKLRLLFTRAPYNESMSKLAYDKYGDEKELKEYSRRATEYGLAYEEIFIKKYLKTPSNILVEGCGAGREALALAKMGHKVTGIDFQPKMIEQSNINAERLGLTIDLKTMNSCKLEFQDKAFDAVIMFGSLLSYIPGRTNRIKALVEASRVLKTNGYLLISAPSKYYDLKHKMYFLLFDNLRSFLNVFGIKTLEAGDRIAVKVSGDKIISKTKCFTHVFSMQEMIDDIHSAGLEFVEVKSRHEIINNTIDPSLAKKDYFMYFCAKRVS